jgi:hypothetical protein
MATLALEVFLLPIFRRDFWFSLTGLRDAKSVSDIFCLNLMREKNIAMKLQD